MVCVIGQPHEVVSTERMHGDSEVVSTERMLKCKCEASDLEQSSYFFVHYLTSVRTKEREEGLLVSIQPLVEVGLSSLVILLYYSSHLSSF